MFICLNEKGHIKAVADKDVFARTEQIIIESQEVTRTNFNSYIYCFTENEFIKKITITTDKPQITADGIDTATITAIIDDPTSTELVKLWLDGTLVDSANCTNGIATFQITMSQVGTLNLTVKSTTKYGESNITIEGVV